MYNERYKISNIALYVYISLYSLCSHSAFLSGPRETLVGKRKHLLLPIPFYFLLLSTPAAAPSIILLLC